MISRVLCFSAFSLRTVHSNFPHVTSLKRLSGACSDYLSLEHTAEFVGCWFVPYSVYVWICMIGKLSMICHVVWFDVYHRKGCCKHCCWVSSTYQPLRVPILIVYEICCVHCSLQCVLQFWSNVACRPLAVFGGNLLCCCLKLFSRYLCSPCSCCYGSIFYECRWFWSPFL